MKDIRIVAIGRLDDRGIRGTRGTDVRWSDLGVGAPGDARTLRAIGGGPDDTFRRLDRVSRALVLAANAAGIGSLVPQEVREQAGLVVGTRLGSLDADLRFARSMRSGMCDGPIFAYTLPSTCLGELALRFALRGPTCCLSVDDTGSAWEAVLGEARRLLRTGEARWVVAAGVEVLAEPYLDEPATCIALVAVLTVDPAFAAVRGWTGEPFPDLV